MKVLAIVGSPKGGESQTLRLTRAVLDGAEAAGAQVELADVCKLNIEYCNACGVCFAKGECVHKDDFGGLYEKILKCDGLVLASPNYFRSVTAQMKALIDRMADAIHCQLLTGKYGCSVATAGGDASHEVTDYLSGLLVGFGADSVGSVGAQPMVPGSMEAAKKKAYALGQDLVEAIKTGRAYPENEAVHREMRGRFKMLVNMNKDIWVHEYEHYKEMGWL